MNTPIGDKLFQDIPRRVANFRKNRPRDVENLLDGKKIFLNNTSTRPKHNSLRYRYCDRKATVITCTCYEVNMSTVIVHRCKCWICNKISKNSLITLC